jgi:hypothetical protein
VPDPRAVLDRQKGPVAAFFRSQSAFPSHLLVPGKSFG